MNPTPGSHCYQVPTFVRKARLNHEVERLGAVSLDAVELELARLQSQLADFQRVLASSFFPLGWSNEPFAWRTNPKERALVGLGHQPLVELRGEVRAFMAHVPHSSARGLSFGTQTQETSRTTPPPNSPIIPPPSPISSPRNCKGSGSDQRHSSYPANLQNPSPHPPLRFWAPPRRAWALLGLGAAGAFGGPHFALTGPRDVDQPHGPQAAAGTRTPIFFFRAMSIFSGSFESGSLNRHHQIATCERQIR